MQQAARGSLHCGTMQPLTACLGVTTGVSGQMQRIFAQAPTTVFSGMEAGTLQSVRLASHG